MKGFASDNYAGAHPDVLAAIADANAGHAVAYGGDPWTARAEQLLRDHFGEQAVSYLVFNGSAANVLSLRALCRPWESVVCAAQAHINVDECGAPERIGGVKLHAVPTADGKLTPEHVQSRLVRRGDEHVVQPRVVSVTQSTELGTRYSPAELHALARFAHEHGLLLHLDGARLANAAAAGFEVKELPRIGVDILVIGGTKAGMPPTEALVLFDKSLSRRFDARLKQAGQLTSKGRFLAAPWIGMLETGAWIDRASHANAMARKLAGLITRRTPFPLTHPVEANAVFVGMDEPALQRLRAEGWFVYRFLDGSVRLMCSWATTEAAVEELGEALAAIG